MKILIVGGTGLIGRRLAAASAEAGDAVVVTSRASEARVEGAAHVRWDPIEGPLPAEALEGVDGVVNLAGAHFQVGRWTESRKRLLWDSRVGTTQRLVESLPGAGVRTLVSASGINYYGTHGDEVRREDSPPGTDFLADLVGAWEATALEAGPAAGVRVVLVRGGPVLAAEGGVLPVVARPVKLFVNGPIGGGRQWISWIHIEDMVGIIRLALADGRIAGPVNAVSPNPVRQADFAKRIGSVLGRPAVIPVPAIALRVTVGEKATLAIDGQNVTPDRALAAGYRFEYPDLEGALQAELG